MNIHSLIYGYGKGDILSFVCFMYFSVTNKGDEIEDSMKVKSPAQEPMVRTYLTIIVTCIIPWVCIGYETVDGQQGAYCQVGYNHLIFNKYGFIKNNQRIFGVWVTVDYYRQ